MYRLSLVFLILCTMIVSQYNHAQEVDIAELDLQGRIVYERVNDEGAKEVVYRSGDATHSYPIGENESYRVFWRNHGRLLWNTLLLIVLHSRTPEMVLIDMADGQIILQQTWEDNWDIAWGWIEGEDILIQTIAEDYVLLHLDGTITEPYPCSFYRISEQFNCEDVSWLSREQFVSCMSAQFSWFEEYYPQRVSPDRLFSAMLVCLGDETTIQHWDTCREREREVILYDVADTRLIRVLEDAKTNYIEYPPLEPVLYLDSFEWSYSGRYLTYTNDRNRIVTVYDRIEDDYLQQLTMQDDITLSISQFRWSGNESLIAVTYGGLSVNQFIGVIDITTGSMYFSQSSYDFPNGTIILHWAFDNQALVWRPDDEMFVVGNEESRLMLYSFRDDQTFVIDERVTLILGY